MYVENLNSNPMFEQLLKKFPNSFSSDSKIKFFNKLEDEYFALKNGVGFFISFDKTIIKLTGNDTLGFLHRISTNNAKELKPFHKIPTLFLNEKGRFITRAVLLNLESYFLLVCPCRHNRLLNWINKYIIKEDIQTLDVSNEFIIIDMIGRQSESYLTLLLGEDVNLLNDDNIINPSIDNFDFFIFRHYAKNGLKLFRILITTDKMLSFIDYIEQNKSVFDLSFVGSDAYEIFRIENGIPYYPSEINDKTNPHENNLTHEICPFKDQYIGHKAITNHEFSDGSQSIMAGFTFDEKIDVPAPIKILNQLNENIGEITSFIYSPVINKSVCLGFINSSYLTLKEKLFIEVDSKQICLSLTELKISK